MEWKPDTRLRPEPLASQQARLGRHEGLAQWCCDWLGWCVDRCLWRHWKAVSGDGCTYFARTLAWRKP